MSEDLKIIQDTRIFQALISKMPETGNQINVFHIGQVINGRNNESNKSFDFWNFLESLPQPRLKNLYEMALTMSLEKCGTQEKAAGFLGITRRVLTHFMHKQKNLLLGRQS